MKKFLAILLAVLMLSCVACGKSGKDGENGGAGGSGKLDENGDPMEYSQSYWEEKYPDYMFCPFSIEENGVEKSYYWPMGYEGLDGSVGKWIEYPFNWNGWHKTADGAIVNQDETLKITDDWANGDESLSSCCVVTTEKYGK